MGGATSLKMRCPYLHFFGWSLANMKSLLIAVVVLLGTGCLVPVDTVVGSLVADASVAGACAIGTTDAGSPEVTVQTGSCTIPTGTTSVACPISPALVDPTRTLMVFQAVSDNLTAQSFAVRCVLSSATTVTCENVAPGEQVDIRWHTASFSCGVRVQHHLPGCAAGGITNVAITAVEPTQTFLLFGSTQDGTSPGGYNLSTVKLTSPTSVEIRTSSPTCGNERFGLQVVEYSGASVTRGTSGPLDSGIRTATAIATPVDLSRTFLLYSYRSPATGNLCNRVLRGSLPAATTISFARGVKPQALCYAGAIEEIAWERVELPLGALVQQLESNMRDVAERTALVTLNTVDLTRSLVFTGGQSISGQALGEGESYVYMGAMSALQRLASSTSLEVQRGRAASGDARFTSFVVQFAR